jgi:glycosyltransferase involved in cell wall biosynthesis
LSFAGHLWNFRRDWRRHAGGAQVLLAYQTVINGVLGASVTGRNTPLVTWIRAEEEYDYSALKYRWLTPPVLRRSARVLVQSRTIAESLLAAVAGRSGQAEADRLARRLDAIPNAVRVGSEPPANGRHGLLAVGRLVPVKGHDVLLRALRSLPNPPPLTIVGEGALRAKLEAAAQGLPVTFLGYVRDLPERMAQHQLLVMPSRQEGFPNVVLEAMERGLPAVTTRVGALGDLVIPGETGLTVPADDVPALAEAISRAYHDPEALARMGRRAREVALGYGWEPHLDRLESLLGNVVAER